MRLLNTNVFVDHLRGHRPAVAFFADLGDADEVAFSALTEAELLAGRANADANRRRVLLQSLRPWRKVDVTNPISELAGDVARAHGMGLPDAIIAATALHRAGLMVFH